MISAELAQSQTGSVLGGRYLLLRVIGTGGMGAVFEAEHMITKRHVAVKLIHAELLERASVAERFLREARAPTAIRHPSIVEVLDAGQDPDGRLFMVFDLLEGCTLQAAIKQERIRPIDTVPVCISVLSVLEVAHAKGLVHRDIKPGNIFLVNGSVEEVKLLDFGIAKEVGDDARRRALTVPGAILGTASYMSPEQAEGKAIDGRADVWAVGATMYRAFTGAAPFGNQAPAQHIASLLNHRVPPVRLECPDISEQLAYVIDRALERDPSERWQRAEEMREALEAAVRGEERRQAPVVAYDLGEPKPWDRTTTRQAIPQVEGVDPTVVSSTGPVERTRRRRHVALAILAGAAVGVLLVMMLRDEEPAPLHTREVSLPAEHSAAVPPPPPEKRPPEREVELPAPPAPEPPPPPAPASKKEKRRGKKRPASEAAPPPAPEPPESPWSRPKREFKPAP